MLPAHLGPTSRWMPSDSDVTRRVKRTNALPKRLRQSRVGGCRLSLMNPTTRGPIGARAHERLDRRLHRVKIDDLQVIRCSGQREDTIDSRGPADENQPASGRPRTEVGFDDHMQASAIHERELAQVEYDAPSACLGLVQRLVELWRGCNVQLTGGAHPRRLQTVVPHAALERRQQPNRAPG
jgi:hypothetical protein